MIFKTKTKSQKLRRAMLREEERIAIREALRKNRKHHHQQVASEPIIHHPGNIDQNAGPPHHRIFIPRREMFPEAADHHHQQWNHRMSFDTEGSCHLEHFRSSPAQQVPYYADHLDDSNKPNIKIEKEGHQSTYKRVRPSSSDQFNADGLDAKRSRQSWDNQSATAEPSSSSDGYSNNYATQNSTVGGHQTPVEDVYKSIKEIELNEYRRRKQMVNDLVKICKAIPLTVEMVNPLINFNGWPNNTMTQHQ